MGPDSGGAEGARKVIEHIRGTKNFTQLEERGRTMIIVGSEMAVETMKIKVMNCKYCSKGHLHR